MMNGPSVGPVMLVTLIMRWPSFAVVGIAGVSGNAIYNELDKQYYVTEKMHADYTLSNNVIKSKQEFGQDEWHGNSMMVSIVKPLQATTSTIPEPPTLEKVAKQPEIGDKQPTPTAAQIAAIIFPNEKKQNLLNQHTVGEGDSLSSVVKKLGNGAPVRISVK